MSPVLGLLGWSLTTAAAAPGAVLRAVATPGRLVSALDVLLTDLGGAARRVGTLLDELGEVPGQVSGLLGRVDVLLAEVREVVTAAAGTVVLVEPIVAQAGTAVAGAGVTLEQAQRVADDVSAVQVLVAGLVADLEPVLRALAAVDPAVVGRLPGLLDDGAVLLAGARALPSGLVDDAAATVRLLPDVLEHLEDRVMPAVGSLEGLVPVVAQLSRHVDSLNDVVADVGALLAGIPGSARLLRRGERAPRLPG